MKPEFSGIERRLEKLSVCLMKLEPFKAKKKEELLQDPYLQDIIERNLEVAAQAVIDIANRIISIEGLEKPRDYYEAIMRLGEADILPIEFATALAPIAGFRNILVHDYMDLNWDEIYKNLHRLNDIERFMENIKTWVKEQNAPGQI
jgi:uncharacterized protein YutE (UPF0331/DUF86 family)